MESDSEEEKETQVFDDSLFPPPPPSTSASSSRALQPVARRAATLNPFASPAMGLPLGPRSGSAPAGSIPLTAEDIALMSLLNLLEGPGEGFKMMREAFKQKLQHDMDVIEASEKPQKKGVRDTSNPEKALLERAVSDADFYTPPGSPYVESEEGVEFKLPDDVQEELGVLSDEQKNKLSEKIRARGAPDAPSGAPSREPPGAPSREPPGATPQVDPKELNDPDSVLDEIEKELKKAGPSSFDRCTLSIRLLSLLKQLVYSVKYLVSSGIGALNSVYESKLYFRITMIALLFGYMTNRQCSEYINLFVGSTVDLMKFIIRNTADRDNLERMRAIKQVVDKTFALLSSIAGFTIEHGIAVIDFLKKVMNYAKDLPEGTFNAVVEQIQEFSKLMKSLQISSDDIKAILESLTALKLSGADMIALLKQLVLIIGEMNANQAMAPVQETILARLLQNVPNLAADVGARAVVSAIANGLSRAHGLPTLTPGGSTRKRNRKHKKTTRKNKKVTKKQKKRRKQNKKTKRK